MEVDDEMSPRRSEIDEYPVDQDGSAKFPNFFEPSIKTAVTTFTAVNKIGFGSSLFTPKSKCLMVIYIYILCFMYSFE